MLLWHEFSIIRQNSPATIKFIFFFIFRIPLYYPK